MTLSRHPLFIAAALLCAGASVQAATPAANAACAGEPAASRAACVREVGAAAQAARAGALTSADAATYERNALARCEVFKTPQDQADCRARMGSGAIVSGSVEGGGILREQVDSYTVTR